MRKLIQLLIVVITASFMSVSLADPITDLSMDSYKAGWYPNFFHGKGPLTCPRTCEAWVGTKSESENSFEMDQQTQRTNVCKVTNKKEIIVKGVNDPNSYWLYGNQFDDYPVCLVHPIGYEPFRSEYFMCLCVDSCNRADLVVAKIFDPVWNGSVSVVKVNIANIGAAAAGSFDVQLTDPGTGAGSAQNVGGLAAGSSVTLTFLFSYWVFDPDAELIAVADVNNTVKECNENNNKLRYFKKG